MIPFLTPPLPTGPNNVGKTTLVQMACALAHKNAKVREISHLDNGYPP